MVNEPTFNELLTAFAVAVASGNEAHAQAAGGALAEAFEVLRLANVRLEERVLNAERQRYAGLHRALEMVKTAKSLTEAAKSIGHLLPASELPK